jgi:hypothetical protein
MAKALVGVIRQMNKTGKLAHLSDGLAKDEVKSVTRKVGEPQKKGRSVGSVGAQLSEPMKQAKALRAVSRAKQIVDDGLEVVPG